MDNGFVVFADDVDAKFLENLVRVASDLNYDLITYDDVVRLEFIRFRLYALRGESFPIDKCPIRTLDIFDEDLGAVHRAELFEKLGSHTPSHSPPTPQRAVY